MTHVVVGYPNLVTTEKLVKLMDSLGVEFIELQIPFSDPLADGPTIMKACEASLANGTKVADAFVLANKLSKNVKAKLLFMAYFNTIFNYKTSHAELVSASQRFRLSGRNDKKSGVEAFCRDAKAAGISGLIIPDMALDEEPEEQFSNCCKEHGLMNIRVMSPASTEDRMKKNAQIGTGFVYCTARQGTTGAKAELPKDTLNYLKTAKNYFAIPLAVGFGISKKEHVAMLKGTADIAVVGSALIDVINKSNKETIEKNITTFIKGLL